MFTYTDNDQLKKELKKCIIDNGYTAKMICDKLDMLPQTYQTLINKKNFSFADMKRILDCMDVELKIDFVPVEQDEKQFIYSKLFVQYQCYYFRVYVFSISVTFCLQLVNFIFDSTEVEPENVSSIFN